MNRLIAPIFACLWIATPVFAQFSAPGPEYDVLKKDVGTWEATIKIFTGMDGSALPQPMVEKGVETSKMIGGYWLDTSFTGTFAGMKFEGHATTGYDVQKKKYFGQWVDSVSTAPMKSQGQWDAETKVMRMETEMVDPAGNVVKGRSETSYPDSDHRNMVSYQIKDGKETKTMEIAYVRKK